MVEEGWQPARLIPTSGINGQDEAERRATSALLAVMASVREFGLAIVKPLGAPSGQLATYTEVPFKTPDGTCRPDGLVQTSRAGRLWTALVEVKTGSASLERAQVETYLDVARENGFDVVLTISNQMAPAAGVHPVDVDKRKLKRVALHHLSWAEVLTIAVQQRVHRGVSDPDQAWILGELIRYLEHPRSGALDFTDMGTEWVAVREAVATGTLRASHRGVAEVVSRWEQLLRFAALRLGRELGADVQVQLTRKEAADPALRLAAQTRSLVSSGELSGTLRIPDAAAPIDVVADLRANRIVVCADIAAPKTGRSTTRINWLVRQLREAPGNLRIDAFAANARTSTSALLDAVREDSSILVADAKRELKAFRVTATSTMGTKRGTGRGGFIDSVLAAIDGFYETVMQELQPWTPKAPQLPRGGMTATEEAGIVLEPPPGDLTEPIELEDEASSTHDEPLPRRVAESVVPLQVGGPSPTPAPDGHSPLISWDVAQDRLDRERAIDPPGPSEA